MALRVVSSQTSTQIERNYAEGELEFPFRNLAANIIRVVRGAGRPEDRPDAGVYRRRGGVPRAYRPKIYRRFLCWRELMMAAGDADIPEEFQRR